MGLQRLADDLERLAAAVALAHRDLVPTVSVPPLPTISVPPVPTISVPGSTSLPTPTLPLPLGQGANASQTRFGTPPAGSAYDMNLAALMTRGWA